MYQSDFYKRYKILANVQLRDGVGWWCTYSVVARNTDDIAAIANRFAQFFEAQDFVIDEIELVGNAEVHEQKSILPISGRAFYDESDSTRSDELQYHTMRWPWSWYARFKLNKKYYKFNKMLAKG